MADKKTGRASDQFPLRLPDGMRDLLKAKATANSRSLNAEIVERLLESIMGWPKIDVPTDLYERALIAGKDARDLVEKSVNAEVLRILESAFPAPIDADYDDFIRKWVDPIMDAEESEISRLILLADEQAKKISPDLSVWPTVRGKKMSINVGVRQHSRLPLGRMQVISNFLAPKSADENDSD